MRTDAISWIVLLVLSTPSVLTFPRKWDGRRESKSRYVGPNLPPLAQLVGYPKGSNYSPHGSHSNYHPYLIHHDATLSRMDVREKGGGGDDGSGENKKAGSNEKYVRPDYSHMGPFVHDMKKNEPEFHRDLWLKVNFLKHKKATESKLKFAKALQSYTRWVEKGYPYRGYLDYTYAPFVPKQKEEFKLRKPGKLQGETLVIG